MGTIERCSTFEGLKLDIAVRFNKAVISQGFP
jgi:hypothetical protein